ncbi:hypothetical protein CHGG_08449 [Chaetomium globosum CBS 148.51]|uniref:Tyrosinase copper-binding domain-containing protein n=1 Tax=Chaetomium globosum (strain ATCC 6205 / CBS 148.51 / DSM 1962 / NBRC 6347 / NRRL 1970) TaxID=306901 RepID=Q2GUA5_CHAGB|nr:uncharacterized protein CHGG_08449 [Chaetomium globosum CBS 148.51]EAQ84435.1 hypothetical protein CHGG_08449 [Chaetomium globosum CBS 148.51]
MQTREMAEIGAIWRSRQPKPDDGHPSLTFTLQTLLARHEAYMASAERDRLELTARIEQLERDNTELEAKNRSVADENHTLRDELDRVNDTVKDAETNISLLEASLLDSQREVRRLESATDRAANLERQIALLEEEQDVLRTTIARTEEESRTTMYRWRQAEKGLSDLQEQLERMEKESREERERHVEVIGRMERQRAMEKELNTAAGRLKGAAAAKSMTDSRSSGSVVSHFVRDLLQDNANLQVGMAELREMLLNSNDEIQMLREQLAYHQPAAGQELSSPKTLQAELAQKEPPTPPQQPRVSQELHIHHHYHVTHKPEARKSRKRRQGLTPGVFTPPQLSAPSSPILSSARFQRGTLAAPLLSPNEPSPSTTRWSLQSENHSEFAPSSAPTSPRSNNRDSLFDRVPDLPSPASPTTTADPTSPGWKQAHRKKVSDYSLRSISEIAMFPADTARSAHGYTQRPRPMSRSIMNDRSQTAYTSPYTTDDVPNVTSPSLAAYTDYDSNNDTGLEDTFSPTSSHFDSSVEQRPRGLRRVISHESIISLSNGLDIHTLSARPSQLSLRPLGLTTAGTNVSAVIAQPTLLSSSAEGKRGSVILRDSIAQQLSAQKSRHGGGRVVSNPNRGRASERGSGRASSRTPSTLGKLVSWRPWGANSSNVDTANDTITPGTSPSPTPALDASTSVTPAVAIPTLCLPDDAGSIATVSTTSNNLSKSPQGSLSSAGYLSYPGNKRECGTGGCVSRTGTRGVRDGHGHGSFSFRYPRRNKVHSIACNEGSPSNVAPHEAAASERILELQTQYHQSIYGIISNRTTGCTIDTLRARKEWSALTLPERTAFIAAIHCLNALPALTPHRKAPGARTRYDDFIVTHIDQTPFAHASGLLTALPPPPDPPFVRSCREECGYAGPMPYWDWTRSYTVSEGGGVWDEAERGHGVGGWVWGGFGVFVEELDAPGGEPGGVHASGHWQVGLNALDVYASPSDPVFWLHHAQVDRVWTIWQGQDPAARTYQVWGTGTAANDPPSDNVTLDTSMDFGMIGDSRTIREVSSTVDGDYCYVYE